MSKNGIIFDLDGTLWDSCVAILPSWQKVMNAHGVKRPPLTEEEMGTYMGKTVAEIAKLMLPELSLEEGVAIIMEGCDEECDELRRNGANLYEDILETLYELSKDYSLYIVSNSQDGYVQTFVDHYELHDIIRDFEMAGRTGKCKGDNIRLVIERNHLDNAVYVGDTVMDKEASEKANVPFVFASYGFGKVDNPAYTLTKPKDLINIAKEIFA